MEQTYLCKFDTDGKRGETRLACEYTDEQKRQLFAEGYIEITEDEWSYYVGNKGLGANGTGYIRDSQTGKPVDAPVYVPSAEEKKQSLIMQYEADKKELQKQLIDALLLGDTETQEEIKAELVELNNQFDQSIKELEG